MAERGGLCQESRCGGRFLWDSAVGQHNLARLQTPGGQGCGDGVRSGVMGGAEAGAAVRAEIGAAGREEDAKSARMRSMLDRKSTRLNSSHQIISYSVFCLKKKKSHPRHY